LNFVFDINRFTVPQQAMLFQFPHTRNSIQIARIIEQALGWATFLKYPLAFEDRMQVSDLNRMITGKLNDDG